MPATLSIQLILVITSVWMILEGENFNMYGIIIHVITLLYIM